ncbi:MAG TPA: hypothetical protein VI007_11210 [bacterium]
MFLGHFAVAMGAKKVAPQASLGTMVLAAQFADLLWPVLLLLGIEHVRIAPGIMAANPLDFTDYPISHSLATLAGWGILIGGLYWIIRRRAWAAWLAGTVVVSHWVLDLVVHRPDLPLVPGGSLRLGLGLWNSVPATLAVELGLFIIGIVVYLKATSARDAVGRYAFWTFVASLFLIYLASSFGPPPPSVKALATTGLGLWLWVLWGYWIDRHREPGRIMRIAR